MQVTRFISCLIPGLLAATATITAYGDPPSSPEQRLAFAKHAAESYRFRYVGQDKSEVKLLPEPILRWNNQVIREDDGFLFIWTEGQRGRPVATSQFFIVGTDWHHEFQSLSAGEFDGRCEGEEGLDWVWSPTSPGVNFVEADDVDPPAGSAPLRLRQMKTIAERFTGAVNSNENVQSFEQLRLLTTPVYRYSANDHAIQDGAIFAFAQGTNPEVLILIEVVGAENDRRWRYGFARMSSYELAVYRDDRIVWKKDRVLVTTPDKNSPYYFRLRAQLDRSAELERPASTKKVN